MIRKRGPWKILDDVEYATLEWVRWFNHLRLLASIGNVSPAEYEQIYYDEYYWSCKAACLKLTGLRDFRGVSFGQAHL